MSSRKHPYELLFGEIFAFAALQATIGSLELPSSLSIVTSVKSHDDIELVRKETRTYLFIAIAFALGTSLYLYADYEWIGAITNMIVNVVIIIWIYYEHNEAIKLAIRRINFSRNILKNN